MSSGIIQDALVYYKPGCPFSQKAVAMLNRMGIRPEIEYVVSKDHRQEVAEMHDGYPLLPVIHLHTSKGTVVVKGYDNLLKRYG